jgi:hypothetical protein
MRRAARAEEEGCLRREEEDLDVVPEQDEAEGLFAADATHTA